MMILDLFGEQPRPLHTLHPPAPTPEVQDLTEQTFFTNGRHVHFSGLGTIYTKGSKEPGVVASAFGSL